MDREAGRSIYGCFAVVAIVVVAVIAAVFYFAT